MSDNLYQTPESQLNPSHSLPAPTFMQKLFSFQGRFSRGAYWGYTVGMRTLVLIISILPFIIVSGGADNPFEEGGPLTYLTLAIFLIGVVFATWIGFAGLSKRWHDRNKSGWMSLLMLVPYIGELWILIECGCLAGTPGPNIYGPDPLRI